MPIYEYACRRCGHSFDVLQKMSDAPLTDCPECGAAELRKLVSAPSFRLKGGGWYETDFKTGNKRNLAGDPDAKPDKGKDGKEASKDGKDAASGKGGEAAASGDGATARKPSPEKGAAPKPAATD